MDTAKVDIRKLQLLCDRIDNMFDALNQVRQSVHGLSSSSVNAPNGNFAVPFANFWQGAGRTNNVWPTSNPWQSNMPQWQPPRPTANWDAGLTHSNPYSCQQTTPNWSFGVARTNPFASWQTMSNWGYGFSHTNPHPNWQTTPNWNLGLSHASPYPYWQATPNWNLGLSHANPYPYWQATPNGNFGLSHANPYPYWQDPWTLATSAVVPAASMPNLHTTGGPYFMAAVPITQAATEAQLDTSRAARMATGFPFAFANGTPRNGQ